ncbi:putative urea ABC transporter substrate-binding protein [Zavarzinia compransoris]|uniref:Lipid kinase n=1 Tax=Zavarzinia compransoris TaxID=1264899 RepID=A0A317EEX3_9PROT|nr:putative urea ABC transporter substrate-binding protein [Zavarzinia compransoris]PWR23923.1 lipid kinase [Zavarzinia compransoris]TDP48168.1 NitT/TauT family transport system substrate-binding protein [Zavarzinia compransoris]
MFLRRLTRFAAALSCCLALLPGLATAETKKDFRIAWGIYAGFMPWAYADHAGIVKKWADKYGITIDFVQVPDYIESVNQYTAGQFDGVTIASMDALTIPAAGGVDSTVLVTGDYSNGNDAIVIKGKGKTVADLKGMTVHVVQFSVSHYTLARALDSVGLKESDLKTVNISDADFVAAFGTADVQALVSWKPALSDIQAVPDVTTVFDSTKIPYEILDVALVNTQVLKDNPALGKALTGAWYETLALIAKGDEKSKEAMDFMAKGAGTDIPGFQTQLDTTFLFQTPKETIEFLRSPKLAEALALVSKFSFEHGLLGEGAKSPDAVGIEIPGGKILGDPNNVKLRYDDSFAAMAAEGKL